MQPSDPSKIYIATDHAGFELKNQLVAWLVELGLDVEDLGAQTHNPQDDYPIFASRLGERLREEASAVGILLCRSGQGMAIVANKFPRIRAAVAWNAEASQRAKEDDNVNVICLPSDHISFEEAKEIVTAWRTARPKDAPKYSRRIKEIAEIESINMAG